MASIAILQATTSQTMDGDTEAILINAASNLVNVTLPVIGSDGDSFIFSRVDNSINSVGLIANTGNTINGSSSIVMAPGDKFRVISYGSNFYLF